MLDMMMTGIGYIFWLSGYRCDSVGHFLNSEYYFKYCLNSTKLLTICKIVKSQAYHRDTDCSSFINISIELHLYILHTHILQIYWPLAAKGWIKLLTRHVLLLIHWVTDQVCYSTVAFTAFSPPCSFLSSVWFCLSVFCLFVIVIIITCIIMFRRPALMVHFMHHGVWCIKNNNCKLKQYSWRLPEGMVVSYYFK